MITFSGYELAVSLIEVTPENADKLVEMFNEEQGTEVLENRTAAKMLVTNQEGKIPVVIRYGNYLGVSDLTGELFLAGDDLVRISQHVGLARRV